MPLPEGERAIPSRWVYNTKRDGILKARFVARGDKQRPGEDYQETFANVACPETLRIIMAIIAVRNLEAHCMDIITAFLHALMPSERPIYLKPPKGYERYDVHGRILYWLLLKALYGLHQSNCLWFLLITGVLAEFGFKPLASDPCVLIN
jgi:hypothetical protein